MKRALLCSLSLAALAYGGTIRGVEPSYKSAPTTSTEGLEDAFMALLGQGNTPALGRFVKEIQRLVDQEMKPKVLETLQAAQKNLDKTLDLFKDCRRDLYAENNKTKRTWQARLSPLGLSHSRCRVAESEALKVKTNTKQLLEQATQLKRVSCQALADLEQQKFQERSQCYVRGNEDYEQFATRITDLLKKKKLLYLMQKSQCQQATKREEDLTKKYNEDRRKYLNKNDECNKGQEILDTASCSYFDGYGGNCKVATGCWSQATAALERAKRTAKVQEGGTRSEWEGLLRLQCLSAAVAARDEDRAATIKACKDNDYTAKVTREIALKYPANPQKPACPMPDDYAGTQKYRTEYYSKLPRDAPAKDCIASCCTCANFECSRGHRLKPNAAKIAGPNLASCCDKTCADFQCPSDYKIKPSPESLVPANRDTCCNQENPLFGPERTCWGYGDPVMFPFAGGTQWQLEAGKWMFVDTPVFQVSAHTCPGYGSTRQHCWSGTPATTKQIALTGLALEGNTLLIQPQDGYLYFNNNRLPINTWGSWRYQDVAAVSCHGWDTYINLKWGIRVRIIRNGNYLNFWFTMRRAPGYERGFCFFDPRWLNIADNFEIRRWSLLQGGEDAIKYNVSMEMLKSIEDGKKDMKKILADCDPADKKLYTASCKRNLPADIKKEELDGCVMDSCARGSKKAAKKAGELYKRVDAVKSMAKPLQYEVAAPGQNCPDGTEPAKPFSPTAKAKVKELLANATQGSRACQPERFYRPGALTDASMLDKACSTGAHAMRLSMPKTKKALKVLKRTAVVKAGTKSVWLATRADTAGPTGMQIPGGSAGGHWVWFDGERVSSKLMGALPPVTTKGLLCMNCSNGTASCQWKVCLNKENHVAICESQLE